MSKSTTLEFDQGTPVLVERTPLPGIVGFDYAFAGWDNEMEYAVTVQGDHKQAVQSVETLAKALGQTIKVHDLEVRA